MSEVVRCKPGSITELKNIVSSFADSLNEEDVAKATRHVYRRAQACLDAGGDTFERRLKKGKASRE